jgi:CheY-like chemotaxis protein
MAHQAKILIVDDRAENLIAIETVLASLNQELVCVRSGEAALEALRADEFAIILLDVVMPGMDGFETAAHIKRQADMRDVPIIFLTAADLDSELAFRGYAAGAVDFITKPFDPRVLRSKVAVFIDLYLLKARELRAAAELSARLAAVEEAAARLGDLPAARTDPAVAAGLASLERDLGSLRGTVEELGTLPEALSRSAYSRGPRPLAGSLGTGLGGQPARVGVLADDPGGDARHHAPVGDHAADHRAGRDHHVPTDPRARQDDRAGPEPRAAADADRAVYRELAANRDVQVLVAVVLVGDVDVGAGPHVVADLDALVRDDVAAPADHAAVADSQHRLRAEILTGDDAR